MDEIHYNKEKNISMKKKYLNFPIDLNPKSHFRTVGIGTIFLNFLVQKLFRVNKSVSFMIHYTSRINDPQGIEIEESAESKVVYQCFASSNGCYMNAYNGIKIAKNVMFASGVKLISANHDFIERKKHIKSSPIIIEENVWLGANVIVLPGVKIGKNSIIGAGSIVTKNVEANAVYVGNPAQKVKEL